MAAITFHGRWRTTQLRGQLTTRLSACRGMLDRFVGDRMRHAAAATENIRRRQPGNAPPTPPADQTKAPAAQFAALGPDVLSETIPAFYIGRNKAGLWIAREATGHAGGIFVLRSSAIAFARARSGTAGCATIFPSEVFELDLVNEGNPLATRLASLIRFAAGLIA